MSQKTLHVVGKNGKKLGGGAAQLHRIKEYGGWDEYHKELVRRTAEMVCFEIMKEMDKPKLRIAE